MRPVSAQFPINQAFASMRTAGVVGNINASPDTVEYWVGRYGNYQPDGHAGCDFACPEGTPVYAMAAGTVLWADWGTKLPGDESWGPNGYFRRWALYKGFPGIVTVIQHPGWIGVYAHLSDAPLNPGDKVAEGQRIATSGSTGGVDPHLHVEALIDLSYPTGNGLIYGRTDPEPFFGGTAAIGPQGGTITTQTSEEDDMALSDDDRQLLQKMHDVTRDYLLQNTQKQHDVTRRYLENQTQLQHDVTRRYLADTSQKIEDVTRQYLADRVKESSPQMIADLVPDTIAQQVIDALAARLGGK